MMESKSLPDIQSEKMASETGKTFSEVHKVGMSEVEVPLQYAGLSLLGRAEISVNLRQGQSRGIHMSRLYSHALDFFSRQTINWSDLSNLGLLLIESQEGLATQSEVKVRFDLPVQTRALKSGLAGFRSYPVEISAQTNFKEQKVFLSFEILYSSTCPQSTALSLEVWKEKARLEKDTEWLQTLTHMPATPHAQRSEAKIQIQINPQTSVKLQEWIEQAESTLSTPVQTLVKKSDEQEFARLNGQNTMFCEDAARRIKNWLEQQVDVGEFSARVVHQESLHPHNAVAEVTGFGRLGK